MITRRHLALALAGLQAADLVVARVAPQFGDDHLDHLGVPGWLRPLLPVIKATAAVALVGTAGNPRRRSIVCAGLVAYYSAATAFHVLSDDGPGEGAPAAALAALAGVIV